MLFLPLKRGDIGQKILLTSQLILISSPKSGGTNQATCNHKKDINDSQHGSDNNKSRTVYFLL